MTVQYNGFAFERIGHASVRIETNDEQVLYIDPWSQVLDAEPHDADVVFVTHDDMDHYDPEAIDTSDLGHEVTSLEYGGTLTADGIEVRAVPAYNRAEGEHVDEDGEPFHAEREVVGLVLTIDGMTVYFPSDTDFLNDHSDLSADVFIPPIGGHFTMDRHEAVRFTESVDPELVLPVHYDTFEQIETDVEAFKKEAETDERSVQIF